MDIIRYKLKHIQERLKMTKKDYIQLAKVLKNAREHTNTQPLFNDAAKIGADIIINKIQSDLMEVLKKDNPEFDKGRFLEACYPDKK
jgi:hypothetical protein